MKPIWLTILFISFIAVVFCEGTQIKRRRQVTKCDEDRCMLLRRCSSFLQMLRKRVPNIRERIRQSRCGRKGLKIKVCCPDHSQQLDSYFPSACGNNPIVNHHIFFGEETEMGEFPWLAAIGYHRPGDSEVSFMCSGSVINARYVLTAAHCVDPGRLNAYSLTVVRLGEWDLSKKKDCFETHVGEHCAPPHIDLQPEKIIPHPMFNMQGLLANDIALIRLNQTIDFTQAQGYIMPICLPPFGLNARFLAQNKELVVVGWGKTEHRQDSDILLKAEVPFANPTLCYQHFTRAFGDKKLCVGGTRKDSCQGDSGSPLMLAGPDGPPYLQVGIVSFGSQCGVLGSPAVYTSVSDYRNWIGDTLEPW